MEQYISTLFSGLSFQYFIRQTLVIFMLSAYGFVLVEIIRGKEIKVFDLLLSFPLALVTYSLSGYFLLCFGIKFSKASVITVMLLFLVLVIIVYRENVKKIDLKKYTVCFLATTLIAAIIATSGIIPVSVTNDSMYFFSEYSRALVNYGELNAQLDNFLTDASQGVAIIGTLPFFFGFDEIFGLVTFLNLDFILLFFIAVYEHAKESLDRNTAIVTSALSIIMLLSSMPFLIMSKWIMANMFFMEYLAIVLFVAYRFSEDKFEGKMVILSLLVTGISIMRMEGALSAGVIVLCILMLSYTNWEVVGYLIAPMFVLQSFYLFRIFRILTLHTKIRFMTEGKALVLLAFLITIMLYVIIVRNRLFNKLKKYYPYILMGGMALVNVAVFAYDSLDYITNLKAFALNVLRNNGWGLFASFFIGVLILIPIKSIRINFFDISAICFVLITIVAGWARGDVLYEGFGDSGNRILIQVAPLAIYCLSLKIIGGLEYWKKENMEKTIL